MQLHNLFLSAAAATAICTATAGCTKQDPTVPIATVEQGFMTPPDSVRIACYWYWLNDNLSPEGVVKDLEAMKRAGITRAQIGIIGVDDIANGPVHYNSEEWWATLRQALKTAGDLDIEIGIFNCPGWSQSGGPWVKPEQSMRYVGTASVEVQGPGKRTIQLPEVEGACGDVAVIAYPSFASKGYSKDWTLSKKEDEPLTATLDLGQKAIIRSLEVKVETPFQSRAVLKVNTPEGWKELKAFDIDRYNAEKHVGFIPYAPIRVSLPETEAQEFALDIAGMGAGTINVSLSECPTVGRSAEKSLAKMCQVPLPMWDYYMWETEPIYTTSEWTIDPEKVVILTDMVKDGVLTWDVPEGNWTIERSSMASTGVTNAPALPDATGLEIDKMSSKHLQAHFDAYIGEILKRIPPEERKTFRILVEDSYETGGQNWTDDLTAKFEERYGYSPLPYLPVLYGTPVGNNEMSDRFLWDLRRMIADLVSFEYVGGLKEISNRNGLTTWLENYGHWGFPGEFLQYGGQSDEIAGEYWSEGTLGDIENRAASSCGHIYGKKKIWAESCTAAGNPFGRYPNVMKQRVDRFFTEGINASLLHLFIHQLDTPEEPGLAAWFGNEFNRKNTWFDHLKYFTEYLRRCNYVLQQGTYVADAAYFIGEDAPKMTGVCDPALPEGYSFDYINADILRDHAKVKNGRLVLDSGMEYSVLVLPRQETMRPEMLDCIASLVKDGLTVVGPAPQRSPSLQGYPEADNRVKETASKLWADGSKTVSYGKGKVWTDGTTMEEVFADLGIAPDVKVNEGEKMPLFIHRSLGDAEVYFVANPFTEQISINPTFRVPEGLTAQWWDAATGEIRTLPQATSTADGTTVPMRLEPLESAFIVLRGDKVETPPNYAVNNPDPSTEVDLTASTWSVSFDPAKGGPAEPIVMTSLTDWTKHPDTNIAHYSGKALYSTTFTLDNLPEGDTWIDLGNVMVTAAVKINGQEAGGVWTHPYRVNATKLLKEGENTLEIEVANNWRNRLIGDAALPEAKRITWVNLNELKATDELQPSGLMGPVTLRSY